MDEIIKRLVKAAYEQGWTDACDDSIEQRHNPQHPFGTRKQMTVEPVIELLDPHNLLGLY